MDRSSSLVDQLANVTDPRRGESVYPSVHVLFMTICEVTAGADDFVAIARFANTKKEWFTKFLDMSAGVPSRDRFNAILNAIKPEEFSSILLAWITQLHKTIAEGADYCLAVKRNQPTLHDGIQELFLDHLEDDFSRIEVNEHHSHETSHGRVDDWSYYICEVPGNLPERSRWKDIKAIRLAINNARRRKGNETAVRFYLISKVLDGVAFAAAVRGHWGIENNCHWQLDVAFSEDQCGIRKGHGDENFSTLRRTALSLLKKETAAKCGVKNKRLNAG